ncbi:hypothetical protein GPX89_05730 [Nocardia sp. ET3-3]|uniref:Uncharacterized protein n=1 Tax=Nocardia terrae TaxID=2675851 RepID=A0A7K1UQX4_9NOCA|nr:I66 family serine proteinase inhibitor [Nocardia terrae]MVU76746.1 hypothetical protein [Nocardia terrae]
MAINSGIYKISSVQGGAAVGVSPVRPAYQLARIGAPITDCTLRQVDDKVTSIMVGAYPYTGVTDGQLLATIAQEQDQDWTIEYREAQNAYTIASVSDPSLVWTVTEPDAPGSTISLRPVITTRSMPPQYLPTQLWLLEPLIVD